MCPRRRDTPVLAQDMMHLSESLQIRLTDSLGDDAMQVANVPLLASEGVRGFYAKRAFAPAWLTKDGQLTAAFEELLVQVATADEEGLNSNDYHKRQLETLKVRDVQGLSEADLVDLELLASEAYLLLASHFRDGRLDPKAVDANWHVMHRSIDLGNHLSDALAQQRVGESLRELLPRDDAYAQLKQALGKFKAMMSEESEVVPSGPALKKGMNDPRIALLRKRLGQMIAHDLSDTQQLDLFNFDAELVADVKNFQRMLNLEDDGIVGPATLQELNRSFEDRVLQVRANLERWRWLPEDLGSHHIRVNIAGFNLTVERDGVSELSKNVIVGLTYRRTPVFSGRMTYLVLNPSWNVPYSIATKDKLPKIQEDVDYLARGNYELLTGWGQAQSIIDPQSVAWDTLSRRNFPYRIRQGPGDGNALGRVKFMFPNEFAVYLHDTPSKSLFSKTQRTFSSGCIRVESPMELAEYLLSSKPGWGPERIRQVVDRGAEATVTLPDAMPVHLLYWTALIENGELRFLNDVYDRDQKVIDALRAPRPTHHQKEVVSADIF